jgi:hypothetical protein
MKRTADSKLTTTSPEAVAPRRRLFAGAATVGAAAAAVAVLPQVVATPDPQPVAKADDDAGGYRLTDHVRHYYRTARV